MTSKKESGSESKIEKLLKIIEKQQELLEKQIEENRRLRELLEKQMEKYEKRIEKLEKENKLLKKKLKELKGKIKEETKEKKKEKEKEREKEKVKKKEKEREKEKGKKKKEEGEKEKEKGKKKEKEETEKEKGKKKEDEYKGVMYAVYYRCPKDCYDEEGKKLPPEECEKISHLLGIYRTLKTAKEMIRREKRKHEECEYWIKEVPITPEEWAKFKAYAKELKEQKSLEGLEKWGVEEEDEEE
ncbi:MAG: hypothetical protein QXS52_03675 [Thermoplasmata archaeon]